MYAGSLAKIAILLSAFRGFEEGTLVETSEIHKDMMDMIRRSNNAAANRMIERIGLRRIEAVVVDPSYRFYDPDQGGGIWLGRRYSNSGEVNPDPIKGLVHAATVTQVCRFYYLLTTGKIISAERSRQMLHILSFPELHDKFVRVMERVVPLEHLYRKSGTWQVWHSDSVLVWDETGGKYILVAMVENGQGEEILRQLVPMVQHLLTVKESPPPPRIRRCRLQANHRIQPAQARHASTWKVPSLQRSFGSCHNGKNLARVVRVGMATLRT